jgi:hypothetical protein
LHEISITQLMLGPVSDAMTHAGQLALMRRLYGSPVPPENFIFAQISPDNLSSDQPLPAAPDAVWLGRALQLGWRLNRFFNAKKQRKKKIRLVNN